MKRFLRFQRKLHEILKCNVSSMFSGASASFVYKHFYYIIKSPHILCLIEVLSLHILLGGQFYRTFALTQCVILS